MGFESNSVWREAISVVSRVVFTLYVLFGKQVYAHTEWVLLQKVVSSGNKGIVLRRNGEAYLIEIGVGCLSFSFYKGKPILVHSPGVFLGVGSSVILLDRAQQCRVWDSEQIQ
jgi:hypothetical protein